VSYWEWFKLIATSFLISCALTAACIALSWLVLRHAPSTGSRHHGPTIATASRRGKAARLSLTDGRCVTW